MVGHQAPFPIPSVSPPEDSNSCPAVGQGGGGTATQRDTHLKKEGEDYWCTYGCLE